MKSTIRRILKEEIKKKYSRPNERIDKSIYNWLTLYFKDSQIYKEEYWKYRGFRYSFCKNGREIADLRITFDDKSPDWGPRDKSPTSERSVKEIILYIYPSLVDMMRDIFPVRKNYLIYLIEEWFEDTKLYGTQQEFGRNDFSLDYVSVVESQKRGDICVPPPQKPEGITKQEMMDYIKKTTLYSYQDMEEHEEDEPGWIEELYLAKLHGAEKERVNDEDRENNPDYDDDDGY